MEGTEYSIQYLGRTACGLRLIMICKVSLHVISTFSRSLYVEACCLNPNATACSEFPDDTRKMVVLKNASVALAAITAVASQQVTDLSDSSWTLTNPSLNISVPAAFPSYIHLDLYASEAIGEPEYGLNDFDLRWIWMGQNWTYQTEAIPDM